ncbi:MAG TPA: FAD-dependent oxidoreductase, partial [Polyangiaceae bacterium]|nr:FAD-dependent oxidoreductase [Polyangiaceae bacterium]
MTEFDALVVGSGPNGLSAAIRLAERGLSTCVIERQSHAGGGLHSLELDEPGFIHDECSAIHPMGVLSPYLRTLDLHEHGLVWKTGQSSVA